MYSNDLPDQGNNNPTFVQFMAAMSSFQSTLAGLGQVITSVAKPKTDDSKCNKVRDLDVFDSSDPRKLKTFFVELALVFMEKLAGKYLYCWACIWELTRR